MAPPNRWSSRSAASRPVAVLRRLTQFAMFPGIDKSQDFRNRRICSRQISRRVQTLGKHPRAVKQLLIKRLYRDETLAAELAAFHADDVEAGELGELAAGKCKR